MAGRSANPELMATAWHEAGHVVVAFWFGLPITEVTIVSTEEFGGTVSHPSPLLLDLRGSIRERRRAARETILAAFAGLHAERLVAPDAPDVHGDADEQNAYELSIQYGILPRGGGSVGDEYHWALLRRLSGESRRLVSSGPVRRAISVLAERLIKRRTMSGADVQKILAPLIPR